MSRMQRKMGGISESQHCLKVQLYFVYRKPTREEYVFLEAEIMINESILKAREHFNTGNVSLWSFFAY